MDIPAIVNQLPLENRVEVKRAISTLAASGVFGLVLNQLEGEIIQAAMVLAHNREYTEIERVSIRTQGITQLFDGLIASSKEN